METPVRRLEGITYWVIEDPEATSEFLNTNLRKEWEADMQSEGRDPNDNWLLTTLSQRTWRLEILKISEIRLDQQLIESVNPKTGILFVDELAERRRELRRAIEVYDHVIWPLVVTDEDMTLVDGYCRYTALKEMGKSRVYAYVGQL